MTLLFFFVLSFGAASTGAIFKPDVWYKNLSKPRWTPPNIVFPIVWSVLYVLIAIAGWLVWQETNSTLPLVFWALQLLFNVLWSWLFFGLRRMDLAFVDIGLLWLSAAGFIVTASAISPLAAMLFAPYLLWISIATMLNLSVWKLNPNEMQGRGLQL